MKLLVVDDDPAIRLIVERTLEQNGKFNVISASSGAKALLMVRIEKPNVILVDYMLSDMNGLNLFNRLADDEYSRSIPVILFSGRHEEDVLNEFIRRGAVGIIPKPFDPNRLSTMIQQCLDNDNI